MIRSIDAIAHFLMTHFSSLPISGIIVGVVAAIVAMGMVFIMLWKVLTTIHDRREYAKFEEERMKARWDTVRSSQNANISI